MANSKVEKVKSYTKRPKLKKEVFTGLFFKLYFGITENPKFKLSVFAKENTLSGMMIDALKEEKIVTNALASEFKGGGTKADWKWIAEFPTPEMAGRVFKKFEAIKLRYAEEVRNRVGRNTQTSFESVLIQAPNKVADLTETQYEIIKFQLEELRDKVNKMSEMVADLHKQLQ